MEDNINKNWKKFLNEEMTKAQELGITEFPFEIRDKNDNLIYYENSKGYWRKIEYDENNNQTYSKNSNGYWRKREYDKKGNQIYFEDSDVYWNKREYDENNNEIYYEDSTGKIVDNRPKQ